MTPPTIAFYLPDENPYSAFSNFSPHGFVLEDRYWPTVEHWFQGQKFVGAEREETIRQVPGPSAAARMGRDRRFPPRPDWESVKEDVMRRGLQAKFSTHPVLRDLLLSTGDTPLVENSPIDRYWGCGAQGDGANRLGALLMELRDSLRKEKA